MRTVGGLVLAALMMTMGALEVPVGVDEDAAPSQWLRSGPAAVIAQYETADQGDHSVTTFYQQVTNADGEVEFRSLFRLDGLGLNSLGYDPASGYIYATVQTSSVAEIPAGAIVAVGVNGGYSRLGTVEVGQQNTGVVGADGYYYVYHSVHPTEPLLHRVQLTTGDTTTVKLQSPVNVPDFAWVEDHLVGVESYTQQMVIVDPETGEVRRYDSPLPADAYGAAWTYGNGSLGFASNAGGSYQVSASGISTDAPVFLLENSMPSPQSRNSDGTYIPGLPVDLRLTKTAETITESSVSYRLTVENDGPGASSGGFLIDELPDSLSGIEHAPDGCTESGGMLTCQFGTLAPGQEVSFAFDGILTSPIAGGACVTNSATVHGNERDPDSSNNTDAASICMPEAAAWSQWKSVSASEEPAAAGTELTYTLHFRNDGGTEAKIDAIDDLTHVLDDAEVTVEPAADAGLVAERSGNRIAITGSVPVGEISTVRYALKVKPDGQRGDDVAANFVLRHDPSQPSVPPAEPECEPSDSREPECTVTPIGAVVYEKQVEASSEHVAEGTELSYTITARNTGRAAVNLSRDDVLADVLDDADLVSAPRSDTASVLVSAVRDDRFSIRGTLAAGELATIAYAVKVKHARERGNHSIDNFLVDAGAAPGESCDPETKTCTSTLLPQIEVQKTSDPVPGATVEPGDEVTYSVQLRNTGKAGGYVAYTDDLTGVLDDAALTAGPVSSSPAVLVHTSRDGNIRVAGLLGAGQTVTVTYTVTVDLGTPSGDRQLRNIVGPTGSPDLECDIDGIACTEHPVGELGDGETLGPVGPADPPTAPVEDPVAPVEPPAGSAVDPVASAEPALETTGGHSMAWLTVGGGIVVAAGVAALLVAMRRGRSDHGTSVE